MSNGKNSMLDTMSPADISRFRRCFRETDSLRDCAAAYGCSFDGAKYTADALELSTENHWVMRMHRRSQQYETRTGPDATTRDDRQAAALMDRIYGIAGGEARS